MSKRISRHKHKTWVDPLLNLSDKDLGAYLFDNERLTTPATIDNNVQQFCKKISPNETPVFLTVQPLSWSRQNYCNKNVEHMIQLQGGKMVLGYKIWYVPRLYVEAERHTVWCSPEGELVDITFNASGENRILFLSAPALKTVMVHEYTKPRDAFHPRVRDFIELQKKAEKFQSQFIQRDDSWEGWERETSFELWNLKNKKAG